MKKHSIAFIILIPLLIGGFRALAQEYPRFPNPVDSLYFDENYGSVLEHATIFMSSIAEKPNSEKTGEHIRLAYFASWNGCDACIPMCHAVMNLWKEGYKVWNDSIDFPAHEKADYNAIRAVLADRIGNTSQAIQFIEAAIDSRILQTKLDSAIQADAYQFLGRLLKNRFYQAKAVSNYRESIRINTRIGRENAIPGIILEKVNAELETNPSDPQILEDLSQALHYYEIRNDYHGNAYAENELGNYWLIQENFIKAIDHFRNSLKIRLENNLAGIDVAYNNISASYASLDEQDSVLYYMQASLQSTSKEDLFQLALLNSNMGAIYGGMNKPDSALFYFKKALNILFPDEPVENISYNPNPKDFPLILPRVIANKGNALLQLSKEQQADEEYLEAALEAMKIAIRQFNQIREMSSYENKHIFARQSRAFYFQALETAADYYNKNPNTENFDLLIDFAQQSKSAVFNEFQRILLVREKLDINPSLFKKDDSLKLLKSQANQNLFNARIGKHSKYELDELYAQIVQLDQEISLIRKQIESDNQGYSKYINNLKTISLSDIQTNLQENETLIDFTVSDSLLIILAINKQNQIVKTVAISDDFEDKVQEYLSLLSVQSASKFSQFVKIGYDFFNTLIKPVDSLINGNEIIVIPDGIIGYLPFDTFSTDSLIPARKHYNELPLMIKSHVIRYLNSLDQLVLPNTNLSNVNLSVRAFAPFVNTAYHNGDINLGVLKGSRKEIEGIAKTCKVSKYMGSKASIANFKERISSPDIIHLATHGILSSGNPMNNRILFSQGKPNSDLPLYQVIVLPIKARLVVLSACETGAGDLQEGEGIMSLTRGFHNAGTESLIMSLWPAYDIPSAKIMEVFYRQLQNNMSLAEAIRFAKLEYLNNSSSSNSHPGFWANYQLSGNDSLLSINSPNPKTWIFILLAGIVILFSIWIIIRRKKRH